MKLTHCLVGFYYSLQKKNGISSNNYDNCLIDQQIYASAFLLFIFSNIRVRMMFLLFCWLEMMVDLHAR